MKAARSKKFEEQSALEDNLEGLKAEKRRTEEERRERERIEDCLAEIEAELEDHAAVLEEREEVNEAIKCLKSFRQLGPCNSHDYLSRDHSLILALLSHIVNSERFGTVKTRVLGITILRM